MKLGWNKRTRENKFITSWKSRDNPETGQYSFRLNVTGSAAQLYILNGLTPVLRAGPWNGITFSGLPGYTVSPVNDISSLYYIDNEEEMAIYYSVNDPTFYTRLVINDEGFAERLNWNTGLQKWDVFWTGPNGQCDKYANCRAFSICDPNKVADQGCQCLPGYKDKSDSPTNTFQGCVAKSEALLCRNGEGFIEVPGVKVPDAAKAQFDLDLGINECKDFCLNNCSCTAYTSANISSGKGCLTWYGELVDVRYFSERGQVLYLRADSSELAKDSKKRLLVLVLPVLVSIFLLILLLVYWFWWKKKQREGNLDFSQGSGNSEMSFMEGHADVLAMNERGTEVICFSLSTMVAATDNFSFSNKLGEGGFGTVYKVWDRWLESKPLEIVDASLAESFDVSEVLRCIHVGLLCVQESSAVRPTMSEAASMLCNERATPSPVEQPAFINRAQVYFGTLKSSSSSSRTGATAATEMTTAISEGR
ncbi:hypothetical protein ACET3Z_028577 [Daucus carota]